MGGGGGPPSKGKPLNGGKPPSSGGPQKEVVANFQLEVQVCLMVFLG